MAFQIKQPKKQKEESLYEEEKSGIDEDLFKLQGEEKSKESEKYEEEKQKINERNQDLEAEESPIKIKDKYTLLVKSDGQEHKITRKDLAEYHRKYALEDGSEEYPLTDFRSLGTINGERTMVNDVYKDTNKMFSRLDDGKSYKTLPDEE